MSEDFLYYVWQHRLFHQNDLTTMDGEPLQIVHVGQRNTHAGPDFSNARVKISDTLWAGNVELHLRTSDWKRHGHEEDPKYENIILHVVYEHDTNILNTAPILVLKDRVDERLQARYKMFQASTDWIACQHQIKQVNDIHLMQMLDRMLVERMEHKSAEILERLNWNKGNWEETMYQLTARNLGLKINTDAFDLLARSLPLNIIAKHKNSLFQIEALLFGQAGMLEGLAADDYQQSLQKEYNFLAKKYQLKPIEEKLWKFMRLRPPAFPTVRIAQLAMLLHKSKHLFSQSMESEHVQEVKGLFMATTSTYWQEHYRFGTLATRKEKRIGEKSIDLLIINTLAPLLFVYAQQMGKPRAKEKALQFLEELSAEKNALIDKWSQVRWKANTAYHSQALLQLKNEHCDKKCCLSCTVGHQLLNLAG
ncbi:MAG: DUF2851 family protein [Chitinophagales bacterium]|nr:DUF2851 family protein [Chitinophagales bacterium]